MMEHGDLKEILKKWSWPLVVVVLVSLSLYAGFYISTATAFPQNPFTHAYFNKIADMPYIQTSGPHIEQFWREGGDCDDRSRVFYNYLKSKGATDVQICWMARLDSNSRMIPSYDGGYGHEFIVWEDRAYNPSINESRRFYDANLDEYLLFMKNLVGFNTFYYENQTEGIKF